MSFTGITFAGHRRSQSNTPVYMEDINYVSIANGIYDSLYMHTASDVLSAIPSGWDWNTIMFAEFSGTLTAGNISYLLSQINAVRVKRRLKGTNVWITMFEVPISDENDLAFNLYDNYVQWGKEYEYALVPVVDNVEASIVSQSVAISFDGMFITDGVNSYHTIASPKIHSYQRNHTVKTVETLGNKYPYYIKNGIVNYDSGKAEGMYLPISNDGCTLSFDGVFDYREGFLDFLTNGTAKILKDSYGQIWMVCVSSNPGVSTNSNPQLMVTSFDWVEIGDVNSQADLYDNGLITVSPHISEG